jgi:hypothetical protein
MAGQPLDAADNNRTANAVSGRQFTELTQVMPNS